MTATQVRTGAGAALALMFAAFIWRLCMFLDLGVQSLQWPFELDYGEGIVWQQANMMFTPRAYGPIDGFPAIVFHYPPLYHVATRAVAALAGGNVLVAGRAISILSTLATALMIGLVSAQSAPRSASRAERIVAGSSGALVLFCFFPVLYWARLMRVDMLADLLSVVGFWLGLKAFQRPILIYLAAICFVGSVFTKQTDIAAPAATFALALWIRPQLAFALIGACLAFGLAMLAVLELQTGGGFLRHIVFYNINRIDWAGLEWIPFTLILHPLIFLVALCLGFRRTYDLCVRRAGRPLRGFVIAPDDIAWVGILFYLVATTLVLGTLVKSGASMNYLLEWLMVIAMVVGGGLTEVGRLALNPPRNARANIGLAGVIALAVQALHTRSPDMSHTQADRASLAAIAERVRHADKPIISDEMVMLLQNGKSVVWEPAIFAELANKGVWDEGPFIHRVLNHDFSMFITENDAHGAPLLAGRYSRGVLRAMDSAYPVLVKQAGFTLHLTCRDASIADSSLLATSKRSAAKAESAQVVSNPAGSPDSYLLLSK